MPSPKQDGIHIFRTNGNSGGVQITITGMDLMAAVDMLRLALLHLKRKEVDGEEEVTNTRASGNTKVMKAIPKKSNAGRPKKK